MKAPTPLPRLHPARRFPCRRGALRASGCPSGFSLVEMAVVLLIAALLLGSGLPLMRARLDDQATAEARSIIEDARDALIGYAVSHAAGDGRPYLPCPDKTALAGSGAADDGQEDRDGASGKCIEQEGNLPWVTLGIGNSDPWGNRLRYRVSSDFSNSVQGFLLTTAGDIDVKDAAGGNDLATFLPAIVLSHGRNGQGARNTLGNTHPSPTDADEAENADGGSGDAPRPLFISHARSEAGSTGGEFDDLLAWVAPSILFNRAIQAGRLP